MKKYCKSVYMLLVMNFMLFTFAGCNGNEAASPEQSSPTQVPATQPADSQNNDNQNSTQSGDVVGIWTETHQGSFNIVLKATDGGYKSEDTNGNGTYELGSDGSGTPWFTSSGESGYGMAITRVDDKTTGGYASKPADGKECMYFEWYKIKDGKESDTLQPAAKLSMADGPAKDWSAYSGGALKLSIKAKDHDTKNETPVECWIWVTSGTGYHEYRLKAEELDNKWHEITIPMSEIENGIDPSGDDGIEIRGYDIDCWIDDLYMSKNG